MFALLVAAIGVLIFTYAASYLGSGERHGRFYGYLLIFGIRPWKEPSDATLHAADRITGANGP